jgi:hypothetical protein
VSCLLLCCSPVRIVNVASTAHMFGKIDLEDLQSRNNYDRWRAYGESNTHSSHRARDSQQRGCLPSALGG